MDLSAHDRSGRVVGLDYGTKRVGLAIADPLGMFAQPLGTWAPTEALNQLAELAASDGLAVIVVGWPLEEDGREGVATKRVADYMRRIEKMLPDVALVKQDERYTSEEAKDRLRGRQVSKAQVDRLAAGIILQEYLDSRV